MCKGKTWFVTLFLMGVVISSGCIGGRDAKEEYIKQTVDPTTLQETSTIQEGGKLPESGEPVNKTKRLILTEYSDFQCPACKYVLPTVREIKATYGDQIDFVYKNFPLISLHENAERAAFAAECARKQGRFWTYHDMLFANQHQLGDENLKLYAREIGLNQIRFNECLDNNETFDIVKNDFETGLSLGVTSTPSFFVDDYKIVGNQKFKVFQKIIERMAPGIKMISKERFRENVLSAGEESCVDDKLNQKEERVDCGGPCGSCQTDKDELVECLNNANATLYFIKDCPRCKAQMGYFEDSITLLNSVNCEREKDMCVHDGVRGYPTWIISGDKIVGATIDSVKQISNCG